MTSGVLANGDIIKSCGAESEDGSMRIYQSAASYLVLQKPGTYLRTLDAGTIWQAINNYGQTAGIQDRLVDSAADVPQLPARDIVVDYEYYSTTTPMPSE